MRNQDVPLTLGDGEPVNTTLVIGGTGKTGRRIVERLAARGVPVRIGGRSASPPFDWEKPETWAPALQGVAFVYISFYPDLALPGASDAIRRLTRLAVQSGVRRLVLLSGRGEEEAERCEQIVRDAGVEWTIVRATWFAQNFSESFWRDDVLRGEVALPAGHTPVAFVDTDDIADVAAAALSEDRHVGQLYELTGPRPLTFADAVAIIAQAIGREVRYVPVTTAEYAEAMAQQQVPADVIVLVTYLFREVLIDANADVADGVQRALGRPPRDFADFARDAAAAGAWDAASR
jgi:uncharacterized protein YbjT (DUF2867 family)